MKNNRSARLCLLALSLLAFSLPAFAQHDDSHQRPPKKQPEVADVVKDLSVTQKRKVEAISKESRERVGELRRQQKAVRDSIDRFLAMDGDQSATLYPLFDREARLRVAVNRAMYVAKLGIDEVLTPLQRQTLRQAGKKEKPGNHSSSKPHSGK